MRSALAAGAVLPVLLMAQEPDTGDLKDLQDILMLDGHTLNPGDTLAESRIVAPDYAPIARMASDGRTGRISLGYRF